MTGFTTALATTWAGTPTVPTSTPAVAPAEPFPIRPTPPPTPPIVEWGGDTTHQATLGWLLRYESRETRRHYATAHREFVTHLDLLGITRIEQVERVHVDAFARIMEEAGYSPNTRALRLAAVVSWFTALVDVGVIATNPAAGIRRPNRDALNGRTRDPGTVHVRKVLAAVEADDEAVAIAVELMARHGFRVSSVAGLRRGDVIFDSSGSMYLRLRTKGGHIQIVRVGSTIARRIVTHMADVEARFGTANMVASTPLLVCDTGSQVSTHIVRHKLAAASRRCGLVHPITAHALRTWAINTALDQGIGIEDVAAFAGHRDVRTTQRYDRRRDRRLDATTAAVAAVLEAGEDDGAP